MRRKPKENNFNAILESIRDLMNEYWLHNICLGYGNPSAAQWTKMPDLLETVDFKDTFLDAELLKQSFPDYQVVHCILWTWFFFFSFSSLPFKHTVMKGNLR